MTHFFTNSNIFALFSEIASISPFFQINSIFAANPFNDSKEFGIISNVTKFIADEKISIRQIIATDPDLDLNPRLTIFTNEEVPGETLSKILEIKGVLTASYGKR